MDGLASLPLLYLCRHGQTDWNAEGRIQGQRDIALNERGRRQARRNGDRLRELLGDTMESFDFIASPLSRTVETMRLLREEAGLPAEGFATEPRLVELHFGDWQGFTIAELARRDPDAVRARESDKWNYLPDGRGAESYRMLADRVRPVFEGLARPSIIVAHGGIARAFVNLYAGCEGDLAAHRMVRQDRVLRWQDGRVDWV